MNKQSAKKAHDEKIASLMAQTRVDNDTHFHFLDEATVHLIDHFDPPDAKLFRRDHAMIIGAAHLGEHIDNDNMQVMGQSFYVCGDIHELSHTIAVCMAQDKAFAHCIFHAMEVFALHDRPKNCQAL